MIHAMPPTFSEFIYECVLLALRVFVGASVVITFVALVVFALALLWGEANRIATHKRRRFYDPDKPPF